MTRISGPSALDPKWPPSVARLFTERDSGRLSGRALREADETLRRTVWGRTPARAGNLVFV